MDVEKLTTESLASVSDAPLVNRNGQQLRFRAAALESAGHICDVISEIGFDPFLENRLALNGEAAIQLCLETPTRIPRSALYEYVGDPSLLVIEQDRPECVERIRLIGLEFGARVFIEEHTDRTLFTFIFDGVHKTTYKFPITVFWMGRLPLGKPVRKRAWRPESNFSAAAPAKILVACDDEIAVHAVYQSLLSTSCSSAHDLATVFQHSGENWPGILIRKAFVWHAVGLPRPLEEYTSTRFDQLTQREIDFAIGQESIGGLGPRLANLVHDTKQGLKPFLVLDDQDREYLNSWRQGAYRPEAILSTFPEILHHAKEHPALAIRTKMKQAD